MEKIAIETNNLTKVYKDVVAVDHVSFNVRDGEIFGLLGPNGAGKTTLIRLLCTLASPTEGTATIAGYDVIKDDHKVRENIGLVSEKMIMYDQLTAKENLKLFGKFYDIPKEQLENRIYELLTLVNMEKWADKQIGMFSTGMKQRINVIRALINQPKILFLDEPTLGLDPQSTSELREFIRKINIENDTTIILTTHMMVEADMLCKRIAIIDYGKIVALDTSEHLKRMVSGTDIITIELNIPNLTNDLVSIVQSLDSVQNVVQEDDTHIKVQAKGDDSFDDVIDAVRKNNGKISIVKNLEPTLEDVFLHVTGHEVRDQASNKMPFQSQRRGFRPRAESRIR
jgi:ABC-2 type transport system ATP-binding protein